MRISRRKILACLGPGIGLGRAALASPQQLLLLAVNPVVVTTTWNPADKSASITLSNGNLTATGSTTGFGVDRIARGIAGKTSGKWYYEITFGNVGTEVGIGIADASAPLDTTYLGQDTHGWGAYNSGSCFHNGSNSGVGTTPTFVAGDVIGVAFDRDNGWLWISKNNVYVASGNPGTGTNPLWTSIGGTIYPAIDLSSLVGTSAVGTANFGATAFAGTLPNTFSPWAV